MKNLFLIFFTFGLLVTISWLEHGKITAYISSRGKGKSKEVPVMQWRANGNGMTLQYGPAVAQDGKIYCGGENVFYCFSPDGKLLWQHSSGSVFQAHPVIGRDGSVYSVSPNSIISYSPDGKPLWTLDAPMTESYNTEPLVTEWGLVLSRQNSGLRRSAYKDFKIVVVDRKGYEREFISFGDKIKSAGLKTLEILGEIDSFLLLRHHTRMMLVSEKGEINWEVQLPEKVNRVQLDPSKKLVAVSARDEVHVYQVGGKEVWQNVFPGDYVSDILISDSNKLAVNINNLMLRSFSLNEGKQLWEVSPDAFAYKLATVFEGRMLSDGKGDILLFNNNGHMAKISPEGKMIGQWEANDNPVTESLILKNGYIYALDQNKNLCAFRSEPESK